MARGFGAIHGTGTTDVISGGTTITLGTTFTIAAWVYIESLSGADSSGFGQIYALDNNGTTFMEFYTRNTNTSIALLCSWTSADGAWRMPAPSLNTWAHVAVTYDRTSTSNDPLMYLNGASQTVTEFITPTGSNDTISRIPIIGSYGGSDQHFAGRIAETGFWNSTILTANEIAALAKGVSPLLVRPAGLTLYCPLYGNETNEQDFGPNRYAMTVTGALKQNHAPVSPLQRGF